MALLRIYQALLRIYRALLQTYRALLQIRRAPLRRCFALCVFSCSGRASAATAHLLTTTCEGNVHFEMSSKMIQIVRNMRAMLWRCNYCRLRLFCWAPSFLHAARNKTKNLTRNIREYTGIYGSMREYKGIEGNLLVLPCKNILLSSQVCWLQHEDTASCLVCQGNAHCVHTSWWAVPFGTGLWILGQRCCQTRIWF